jgi:2-keto-4-pentenoate hydratase/2-oxohepta-3-ene-1,7-dioic acid hydratase in catechol pathway
VMHKNFDTSCSLGPCLVTKDEIPDPYQLLLQLWVNGGLRQNGRATLMMRRFPAWMQRLSTDMTLYPGDMIASGTPSGTAMDSSPKNKDGTVAHDRFLNVGDVVELKVENIGSMKNKIVAE